MNCPVCPSIELKMSDRHGIEIDYCPKCRGVWLDRGELDKIIERSSGSASDPGPTAGNQTRSMGSGNVGHASTHPLPPPGYPAQGHSHGSAYDPNDDSKYGYRHDPSRPYQKRKSVWREIFDFD